MKNRVRYRAVTGVLAALLLAGCGDGSGGSAEDRSVNTLEPVALSSEPESGQEEGTPESVETPVPAEDALMSSIDGLGPEMEAAVLEAMKNLIQNLELPEYIGEAIHLVSSEEWFAAMAGGLYEGCRSYTMGGAGDATLSVQVGYDIEDKPFINACYQANGQVIVLKQARGVTWLLQTSVSDGAYNGAFEKWQINSGTGYMLKETGTYANGIVAGEYTKSEHTGEPGEAFDLWTNRDNFEYDTTSVTYDGQGQIMATPSPEPTPTPTPKPPTPTKKPAQTTAPTKAPTPAPPQEPQPPQQPAPPQEPDPEPEPTQEPPAPSEGDTDIDWSPDMM